MIRLKRVILSLLFILLFTGTAMPIFGGCLFAADNSADAAETVRVGYYENEIFQEGAKEGLMKKGYAYEYYRKLSEYTGWRYEYVYGDYGDLYQKLLNGEIDLLAGLAYRVDREGLIYYPSEPMGSENYSLIIHDFDEHLSSDLSTLNGVKIGVLDSAMVDVLKGFLDTRGIEAETVLFGDYDELLNAFDKNEVDVAAVEGDGTYDRQNARVLCAFGASDYYLCVSIKRKDLLDDLNMALVNMDVEEPGYLNYLRSKYYNVSVSSKTFSEMELEWLDSHARIRIGYLNDYLPYSDTDKNGNPDGVVSELVPELFKILNIDNMIFEYIGYDNYDDMIEAVRDGNVDAAFPVGGGLYYSEESGIYQLNSLVSAPAELVFLGEYDAADKNISFAVNRNNRMQDYFIMTYFPEAEIRYYDDIDACLMAVINSEVKATTLNGLRAGDILRNSRYRDLSIFQLNMKDERSFGVKIGNEGLLKLLNRGINVVGGDYVQSISMRYSGKLYSYSFHDMIEDFAWVFISAILVIILILAVFLVRDSRRADKQLKEKRKLLVELEEKKNELSQCRDEISVLNKEAEQANRSKSEFVTNVSHEISTPIVSILGMNEMIQRKTEDEEILDYSDKIRKTGTNLLGIVNDISDFSRIESGGMVLSPSEYELSGMVFDLVNLMSLRADEKGLLMVTDIDPTLPARLIGDMMKIKQVVANILTNAFRFTQKGSVTLKMQLQGAGEDYVDVFVSVTDTGVGMKPDEISGLYSVFDRDDENPGDGSGLGLTIAKKLLELMNSDLRVTSTYGEGTSFYFLLRQQVRSHDRIGNISERFEHMGKHNMTDVLFKAPSARIMLVDDTEMNLQMMSGLLEINDMEVVAVSGGKECIERFAAERFDMVFMDYRMPEMDGVETLWELRRKYPEELGRTAIIAMTSGEMDADKDRMFGAGFRDYISKPVNIADMEDMLLRYLPPEKVVMTDGEKSGAAAR